MRLTSTNSSSSAKAMMSSKRARASRLDRPSMTALMITFSRAGRSMLKPTPSSMNGETRPRIPTVPESMP